MGKKQLYGFSFNSNGGGAAANLSSGGKYIPRSITESYVSSDHSLLSSSRYLASPDPLFSSSSSSMLFGHAVPGAISSPTTTHLASQVSWSGPPGVDVGVGPAAAASDLLHADLKRPASGGTLFALQLSQDSHLSPYVISIHWILYISIYTICLV